MFRSEFFFTVRWCWRDIFVFHLIDTFDEFRFLEVISRFAPVDENLFQILHFQFIQIDAIDVDRTFWNDGEERLDREQTIAKFNLPNFRSQICGLVLAKRSWQIFSIGMPHDNGLEKSPMA